MTLIVSGKASIINPQNQRQKSNYTLSLIPQGSGDRRPWPGIQKHLLLRRNVKGEQA